MDAKMIADGALQFVGLGIVGSVVGAVTTWISNWSREYLAKLQALREFERNPHAHVGACLLEWRDAANRQVIGECQVVEARLGRVVLRHAPLIGADCPTELVLTIREFQAGHALWDVREDDAL